MASIEKRSNGTWRARYRTPDGKSRGQVFPRKIDAERFLTSIEHSKMAGAYVDPSAGKKTFGDYSTEWAEGQDWKATTRGGWAGVMARLTPFLDDLPLTAIDRLVLQRTQLGLAEKYARATTTLTMSYAGSIMRSAYAAGIIGRDPTKGLRALKARDGEHDHVGPDDVPTRAEATAILEGAPSAYRAAVALGLAGLRIGEVLGMSADRIELETRLVTIDRQMQRIGNESILTTPKGEKARTIKVPGAVILELRRHLRDHQGEGLLFRGRRGTPEMRRDAFYGSAWRPALVGAGMAEDRFKFHSLRHFCASSLLAEGASLTAVAGHLGDTVETVSRTYVHWLRDDRDVPAEILERVLAPASRVTSVSRASGEAL